MAKMIFSEKGVEVFWQGEDGKIDISFISVIPDPAFTDPKGERYVTFLDSEEDIPPAAVEYSQEAEKAYLRQKRKEAGMTLERVFEMWEDSKFSHEVKEYSVDELKEAFPTDDSLAEAF